MRSTTLRCITSCGCMSDRHRQARPERPRGSCFALPFAATGSPDRPPSARMRHGGSGPGIQMNVSAHDRVEAPRCESPAHRNSRWASEMQSASAMIVSARGGAALRLPVNERAHRSEYAWVSGCTLRRSDRLEDMMPGLAGCISTLTKAKIRTCSITPRIQRRRLTTPMSASSRICRT